ncbi:putative T6SS immunity periplasmic lipoprotein [Cronobacter sakazakii]|uniref:putative T6SS immunity periplasmic lipoprotein n=1 Tax=Cronobacter sakazakii TaxID=28141 RepID=UPI001F3E4AA3|nr:putative T6SS immunity periplasmic lipoprotein [Cronobacter sakazakii]
MVSENNVNTFNLLFLSFACVSILTGCPGPGDIMRFDETAKVSSRGRDVCINIDNAQDYQPVDIGINLRGIPPKEKKFDFSSGLRISAGELCIPPSYYNFENGNKYIVEFVLHATSGDKDPRSFVVGVGVNNNHVYNFPLSEREFARPYGSIQVPE